ncbi:hypothetical protein PM082_011012 [Marasmius tenuissimus]|nr:hypothetical protein PM082_011012 [Marasmius tenuissimus]
MTVAIGLEWTITTRALYLLFSAFNIQHDQDVESLPDATPSPSKKSSHSLIERLAVGPTSLPMDLVPSTSPTNLLR